MCVIISNSSIPGFMDKSKKYKNMNWDIDSVIHNFILSHFIESAFKNSSKY